jgi:hypothetical protein
MKTTITISTKTETLDVLFDIDDEGVAQAKLAQTLQDIQKRFCARSDSKKAAPSTPPKPGRETLPAPPAAKP